MAYGTVNTDIVSDSSGGRLAPISSVFRNRIINGAMVINQRGFSGSANNVYTLDRYIGYNSASSKYTVSQSSTAPVGFTNSLLATSSAATSLSAGDYYMISQLIEGYNVADLNWGTANAKTVTLSFQVYSSLTGTFGGALQSANSTRSYPFTYSIPVANTWTPISITIAGDTTGTWLTTNGAGIGVLWGLGVGSTYSGTAGSWSGNSYFSATGATSVVGTNGATFYITGVQLEVGSSATGFEYVNYQTSLANCQRYYVRMANNSSTTAATFAGGSIVSTTDARVSTTLPTTMRASPTMNYGSIRLFDGATASAVTSIAQSQATTTIFAGQFTASAATFVVGRGANIVQNAGDTTCYIDASAEL